MKTFLAILTLIPFAALHADSDNPTGSTLQLDTTVTYGSTLSLRGYDSGATITAGLVTGITETSIAPLNLSVFDSASGSLSARSTTGVTMPGLATTTSGLATSLTKTGNGVLNLVGNSTYSGSLEISSGALNVGNSYGSVLNLNGNAAVLTDFTNPLSWATGLLNFTSILSGGNSSTAGGIVPASSGTLTLNANPTLTLNETNVAGVVVLDGSTGVIGGSASVQTNAGLTLANLGTFRTIATASGVISVLHPLGGTITINGNATTNLYVDQTLASLNIANGVTLTFGDGLPLPPLAGGGTSFVASDLAVPEPGSAALLTLGALALLGKKRRAA